MIEAGRYLWCLWQIWSSMVKPCAMCLYESHVSSPIPRAFWLQERIEIPRWSWSKGEEFPFTWQLYCIWQLLSWTHHLSAARAWKWKWSNGVEKSETDLFWCISMTNNVKSCKKINGRVQTFRFSVFTMGLCWKRQKNTKTRETKTQITQNFEKVWPI